MSRHIVVLDRVQNIVLEYQEKCAWNLDAQKITPFESFYRVICVYTVHGMMKL